MKTKTKREKSRNCDWRQSISLLSDPKMQLDERYEHVCVDGSKQQRMNGWMKVTKPL